MCKLFSWAVVLVCSLTLTRPLGFEEGQKEPPKNEPPKKLDDAFATDLAKLMKRKLENAQKVLEGIAVNNPDKVGKHAEELVFIRKQAEWKVLKTPEYEVYSNQFQRNAEDLIARAKDKNIDGAALAYVDMTLTCVKCHKYVRESRRVYMDIPESPSHSPRGE